VRLLAVAWLLAAASSASADYRARAFVEPGGRITDTQTVRLIVEVEGEGFGPVSVPRLPALVNLKLIGGPSSSQSTVFRFNGTQSRQVITHQLIYALLPQGPGPASIPPIEIHVGSDVRLSEPIAFEVVRGTGGRPGATARARQGEKQESDEIPVFVGGRLGSERVWVGEVVETDVTLYAAARVTGLNLVEEPSFSNFWVEDAAPDPAAEGYRTTIDGRQYNAYPIVRKVLVPTTPGSFTLTPYGVQIQVSHSTGDAFRDFFSSSRGRNIVRRTEPLRLEVRPLPDAGRPSDFTGAVGSFSLEVVSDREVARVNDAVALKATVAGVGFLKAAPPPVLKATPDLKVFEPKITETSEIRGGKLHSRKTWEWIVVPLTPGEMTLPTLRYPVFDPATGAYDELAAAGEVLTVERGNALPDEAMARGDLRLERHDISFIKPLRARGLRDGGPRIHQKGWFMALLLFPAVMAPVVIIAGRRHAHYRRDHGLVRARRARSRARKTLRATGKELEHSESGSFYQEVARALVEYLADRFDRSASGLTYDVADELLASRDVDAELRGRVRSCLETCDFARFVSTSDDAARRREIHRDTSAVLDELEKVLS
jgi:hypothetical protein